MNANTLVVALIISTVFCWPITCSYFKVDACWIGTVVMVFTTIGTASFFSRQIFSAPVPPLKILLALMVIGVINGFACYLYSIKVASVEVPTAPFMITVSIGTVVIAPMLNWILNGSVPTMDHVVGYTLAIGAIYQLSK